MKYLMTCTNCDSTKICCKKMCQRCYQRAWRKRNPGYYKEYYSQNSECLIARTKQYHDKNHEEYKSYHAAYREKNREQINQQHRDSGPARSLQRQLKKYHIPQEEYNYLRSLGCEICGKAFGEKNPCFDHCHNTGQYRGLLCSTCNSGIGLLKDNIKILQKALDYLSRSKSHFSG